MKQTKPDVGFLVLLVVCRQWLLHSNVASSIKISDQPQELLEQPGYCQGLGNEGRTHVSFQTPPIVQVSLECGWGAINQKSSSQFGKTYCDLSGTIPANFSAIGSYFLA